MSTRPLTRGWLKIRSGQRKANAPDNKRGSEPSSAASDSDSITPSELSSKTDAVADNVPLGAPEDSEGSAQTPQGASALGKENGPDAPAAPDTATEETAAAAAIEQESSASEAEVLAERDPEDAPGSPSTPTPSPIPSPPLPVSFCKFLLGRDAQGHGEAQPGKTDRHPPSPSLASVSVLRVGHLRALARSLMGIEARGEERPCFCDVSIEAAQDTILWRDSWNSLRVFGIGLYLLIALKYFVSGEILLLPSSCTAGAALAFLFWNVLRNQFVPGRAERVRERELQAQKAATDLMASAAAAIVPLAGAVVGLSVRCLSGRELGPTIWAGMVLAAVFVVGELHLLSQVSLATASWLMAFTLPWLYLQCRHALDLLAEEAVRLAASRVMRMGWLELA
eukprot:CAMPEP_0177605376 /NCGR_PEP_ID=MMETSP0419_2-20121207/16666_1 /TAXON_ID=582737 /ORGANISM="Tetraselmis sp., Strain GSL018" /LENGTH=394 /DNA_ID=CAMNT_0019099517 /DNA_START=280 /DNA_END=1460 /DNA_ORIENTATION=+